MEGKESQPLTNKQSVITSATRKSNSMMHQMMIVHLTGELMVVTCNLSIRNENSSHDIKPTFLIYFEISRHYNMK